MSSTPTIPEVGDSNKQLSSVVYNIDSWAYPDTLAKTGTLEGVKRNEDIWVFVAWFFAKFHVSLRPGVTGRKLAAGLKFLNDRLRPLYENLNIPCGFANRCCIGAASSNLGEGRAARSAG